MSEVIWCLVLALPCHRPHCFHLMSEPTNGRSRQRGRDAHSWCKKGRRDQSRQEKHLPHSKCYARHLSAFFLVITYEEDINFHPRKLRFWETCFLPLSFTQEMAPQVIWWSRQKPKSCPWFFSSNQLHQLPTLLTFHGQLVNGGVKFKRWSIWWHSPYLLSYLPPLQGKSESLNVLISNGQSRTSLVHFQVLTVFE